ncbi:hypothetical protein VOLCADRAFT_87800, partial [Volvox carteri f. nagariensis]
PSSRSEITSAVDHPPVSVAVLPTDHREFPQQGAASLSDPGSLSPGPSRPSKGPLPKAPLAQKGGTSLQKETQAGSEKQLQSAGKADNSGRASTQPAKPQAIQKSQDGLPVAPLILPSGGPPRAPQRNPTAAAAKGNSFIGNSTALPRATSGGSSSKETDGSRTRENGGQARAPQVVPSYLDGRRTAVFWQWNQFLGSREGPQSAQNAAGVAGSSDPRVNAVAAAAAAPPATTPPAPAASSRPSNANNPIFPTDAAAATAARAAGSTRPPKRSQPTVQVSVPGIMRPPPRDVPSAATGEAAGNDPTAVAAAAAAEAASLGPRVPAALLPLTLQGRILLMEAAMEKAKDTAGAGAALQRPPKDAAISSAKPAVAAAAMDPKDAAAGGSSSSLQLAKPTEAKTSGTVAVSPASTAKDVRRQLAEASAAAAAAEVLPPGVAAARELLAKLVRYIPTGREDGAALLAPYARYQYGTYQDAAAAAAAHPDLVVQPLGLQQLSYIAAAYAAAGHRHEPFLRALTATAAEKMATVAAVAARRARRGSRAVPVSSPTAPSPAAPLTFRTACVMLTALARLRYRDARLMAALGRWLAAALRSGDVTPRAKWKGTWLAAALWAYATLEQTAARDGTDNGGGSDAAAAAAVAFPSPPTPRAMATADASTAGAVLFAEAAEAVRVDPGWIHLMDCREALWALWALKVAAVMYGGAEGTPVAAAAAAPGLGTATAAAIVANREVSYTPQTLVELQLLERAASQNTSPFRPCTYSKHVLTCPLANIGTFVFWGKMCEQLDQLDPGQLAEAYGVAAEAGFGADPDMLAALRRCTLARIAAIRPQPLTVMVASLAVLQIRDVTWLSALAAACRNQMINMDAQQIVVLLHSFAVVLRFYYMPLFHAAVVMCTLPGFARLEAMSPGDMVRLAAAFSAVGHYETVLLRKMAERMMTHGSLATAWQRASVLLSCAHLSYRSNGLLRAVAADAFGLSLASTPVAMLPPAQLAAVAAACGHLQFRPRGLLSALHTVRSAEWPRLSLSQRAALCWAILVLTGGLAEHRVRQPQRHRHAGAEIPAGVAIQENEQQQDQGTQHQHQQRQHLSLLSEALHGYLQSLATYDRRTWPSSGHHAQLLVACSVISWHLEEQQPQQPQQQATGEQQQKQQGRHEQQQQRKGGGPGSTGGPASASPGDATGGGGEGVTLKSPGGTASSWATLAPKVREALRCLPAAATRRTLKTHNRLRLVALGSWAAQVAGVVRQVLDGAAAADAAPAATQPSRPWLGNSARSTAAAAATMAAPRTVRFVRGGAVTTGLLLCGGALSVDLCVEVELETVTDGTAAAAVEGLSPVTEGSVSAPLAAEGPAAALANVDGAEGQQAVSDGGGRQLGSVSSVRQLRRRSMQKVRIALELSAFQPPGAAGVTINAAAGPCDGSGSGVVRNSAWMLSGGAALRRRLLVGLGWVVVVVRERMWDGLRSPEQQRRAVEAMLRRAVLQAVATGAEAAGAAAPARFAAAVATKAEDDVNKAGR